MAQCLPNKMEIRSTRRQDGLSSERKARKPVWKGWLYVLICRTRKIRQRRSEFSPWVQSCVEWECEKGKGVNSRTNKKANEEWHTCTQVLRLHGTTGLSKGFEKAGLKWIKSMGTQLLLCRNRQGFSRVQAGKTNIPQHTQCWPLPFPSKILRPS